MGLAAVKASTALYSVSKDRDRKWRDTGGSWGDEDNVRGYFRDVMRRGEIWGQRGHGGTYGRNMKGQEGTQGL